jgi:hypothetical protein
MNNLTVKVGDVVLVRRIAGPYYKQAVTNVTRTGRFTAGGVKYTPDGRQIGSGIWHRAYAQAFDQEIWDKQLLANQRTNMSHAIRNFNWLQADTATLTTVYEAMKSFEKETNG